MSIQAMAWAIEQQEIKDSLARHVLLCLANYADNDGGAAFPSAATLSTDTGMSERSVRNKLKLLEHSGLIRRGNQAIVAAYIDRGDLRPICFDLAMPEREEKRGARGAGRSKRGAPGSSTGCTSFQNGVQEVPKRGARGADNPSHDPSLKPSFNQNRDRAVALPDWLSAEAWEKFVAFRKAGNGKRKFTEHAEELLLADLAALRAEGHDPVKVIQQSIKRGWAGLFKISGSRADAPGVTSRDESRAAAAASIGLGAHAHDDEPTVIDADFRRIS
ncbi:helix-turn-helix domain-containing protein [Paraburkholderia tropica]|uniref:helix-turn-helix domain-containing protein n=1 Tax=Paraburkholderia tropica TaxID=92647 RepID=UPI003D2A68CE